MNAAGSAVLAVDGVVAGYGAAEEILKGTSVLVNPGEIVSIIGANVGISRPALCPCAVPPTPMASRATKRAARGAIRVVTT